MRVVGMERAGQPTNRSVVVGGKEWEVGEEGRVGGEVALEGGKGCLCVSVSVFVFVGWCMTRKAWERRVRTSGVCVCGWGDDGGVSGARRCVEVSW